MNIQRNKTLKKIAALTTVLSMALAGIAQADIQGITGISPAPAFSFTAKADLITSGDGSSVYMWGYSDDGGHNNQIMQYPGPTMIVTEGDVVTVSLTNDLPDSVNNRVSMIFPGQVVSAAGGSTGLMTQESDGPADTVTYTFTASHPGTYVYHSGTRPELQTEMGLLGALIVRPSVDSATTAYGPDTGTEYENEWLYLVSQVDSSIHSQVQNGNIDQVDMSKQKPRQWFINGRSLSDDLFPNFAPWLPTQPYSALIITSPGARVLARFVGASRDTHPPHLHGNNFTMVARDGRVLQTAPGAGGDLAINDNTMSVVSLATHDAIWQWTGKDIGWDIYGNPVPDCVDLVDNRTGAATPDGYDDEGGNAWEWCADDAKPFPVVLPELQDMMFGGFYSGSPFLGSYGALPIGEGGLNLWNGYLYPWHSHTEFELTNDDVFPGGMFTAILILPPAAP